MLSLPIRPANLAPPSRERKQHAGKEGHNARDIVVTRRRPLRRTITAAAGFLAFAIAAMTAAPAGSQGSAVGFSEGRWIGSFSYLGTTELGGVPVRYRGMGTFELVSSDGGTTGLWDMNLVSLIDGGVANAIAGGPAEGDMGSVVLELDSVTAKDALTGMEITLTAAELPESGAGFLEPDSNLCGALSGVWEIPFTGFLLEGSFIANRTADGTMGPAWQSLQQKGLDLLGRIDDGEVPIDEIRSYLQDAESVMGDTTTRDETCDEETYHRFNTAALALGDAMVSALASRLEDLTDDQLLEVTRMGYRSGAFLAPDLAFPYETALGMRMTTALADEDLPLMEYWLPVAREFGRDNIARNLANAIEEARR